MTHNCPKLEKYLFPGISGCIFAPGTGVLVNLMSRGFRICMAKGVEGVKNAWLWAAFDQSLSYSGELIESCHNQIARFKSSDMNFSIMHLLEPQLSYHADFESESNRCLHSGNPTDTSFQLNQSGSPGIWMLTNINLSLLLSLILTQDLKLDRPICWSIHVMSCHVVSGVLVL